MFGGIQLVIRQHCVDLGEGQRAGRRAVRFDRDDDGVAALLGGFMFAGVFIAFLQRQRQVEPSLFDEVVDELSGRRIHASGQRVGLGGDARIERGVLVVHDRGVAAHRVYSSLRPQGGEQDPRRVDVPERDLIRPRVSRFVRGLEVIRFIQRGYDRLRVFLPVAEFADAVLDRAAVVNRSRQRGLPHRGLRVGVKFDDRSRIVDRDFTAGGGNRFNYSGNFKYSDGD